MPYFSVALEFEPLFQAERSCKCLKTRFRLLRAAIVRTMIFPLEIIGCTVYNIYYQL